MIFALLLLLLLLLLFLYLYINGLWNVLLYLFVAFSARKRRLGE